MNYRTLAILGAASAFAMGLAVPAGAATVADADIVAKIQTAKTPGDHEAIADYYDSQAADAKSKADLHRKMASSYTAGGTSIGKGSGSVPLPAHCANLAKDFDEEAANYTALAQAHRAMAKAAK
jgi:hypothetical protein